MNIADALKIPGKKYSIRVMPSWALVALGSVHILIVFSGEYQHAIILDPYLGLRVDKCSHLAEALLYSLTYEYFHPRV